MQLLYTPKAIHEIRIFVVEGVVSETYLNKLLISAAFPWGSLRFIPALGRGACKS